MNKKLIFIGNYFVRSGQNIGISELLAQKLNDHGWSVMMISDKANKLLRCLDLLINIINKRNQYEIAQIDVFSGMAFVWAELSCWALKLVKRPYVLTLHGGNLPDFSSKWPERVRHLLKGATEVTAPSRYLQREISQFREDIILIPNPLENENYPYNLRMNFMPRLVWLRAFHAIYNPHMAPLVINLLKKTYPDISLTMIGPDKMDGTLQKTQLLIDRLGLQNNIKIILGVPKIDVPDYLNSGDIFINTTNIDNSPVSVVEAMACGLCVVSTNVGGIPYLLDDGKDALLVPPNNPESMAIAVERILSEPGLASNLTRNAHIKAEQFNLSVVLPQWESLFTRILLINTK